MTSHEADNVTDLAEYRRHRAGAADAAVLAIFSQITGRPLHLVSRTPEELAAREERAEVRRAARRERIRMQLENGVLVYQDDDPDGIIGA